MFEVQMKLQQYTTLIEENKALKEEVSKYKDILEALLKDLTYQASQNLQLVALATQSMNE